MLQDPQNSELETQILETAVTIAKNKLKYPIDSIGDLEYISMEFLLRDLNSHLGKKIALELAKDLEKKSREKDDYLGLVFTARLQDEIRNSSGSL